MRCYLVALLLFAASGLAVHPLFDLGPKWQIVVPRELKGEHFDYMFLNAGRSIAGLRLVLAHEPIEGTLEEYLTACVKLNQVNPGTKARRLGSYTTKRGLKGELLEVEADGIFGRMTTVQLITAQDEIAYVLTITTDKKSFLKEQKTLMEIFDSFWLCDDPIEECLAPKVAATLKQHLASFNTAASKIVLKVGAQPEELFDQWRNSPVFCEKLWPSFARLVEKHFADLGPIWQLETLKWCASHIQNFSFAEKSGRASLKKKGDRSLPLEPIKTTQENSAL